VTCPLPEARYSGVTTPNPPEPRICIACAERLLAWFARHARDLPWQRERTPYRVWVAEVMLQQTRAETVVGVCLRG